MESGFKGPSRSPGGSVKRARQRAAQEAQSLRVTINPDPVQIESPAQRGSPPRFSPPSRQYPQYPLQSLQRPPMPPAPSMTQFSIDASDPITRDNQSRQRTTSPTRGNGLGRGPPPQRPPRPSVVPSMVDPSQRAQFYQQPQHNRWDGGYISPPGQDQFSERYSSGSSRPTTTSSGSSTGTIPDFPIASPQLTSPPIPRRSGNLGPPPSARKGGATFYSQNSYVAPIPEEQPESHNSYASSHVIPASWGDGAPESYINDGIDEEDEDSINSGGRHSRAGDHDENTGLVRKVSIGKPGKPSLKNIKSGEALAYGDTGEPSPASSEERPRTGLSAVTAAAGTLSPPNGPVSSRVYPQLEDASAYPAPLRPSAPTSKSTSVPTSGARTPTTPLDPRVKAVLGGLEKGGAIGSNGSATPLGSVPPSMSDRGTRRPARLNLEAVRESEQSRGSSSSLPELIRRATKLASNLERGRTSSALGFLGMLEEKEKDKQGRSSRSGSISDMLARFPSPSLASPAADNNGSRWPSPLPKSGLSRTHTAGPNSPTSYTGRHRSRKCCGMPTWAFILLCIILILLIAAAVVIPVTLIVLPKKNDGSSADISACKSSNPCSNGGTTVLVNNNCRCVCANGFTGSKCTAPADIACTSTDATDTGRSTFKNATLGTGIPRLLTAAQANFSIPLSTQTVLSLFASQNLTCTNENALVTLDGKSQRRRRNLLSSFSNLDEEPLLLLGETPYEAAAPLPPIPIPASTLSSPLHPHPTLARRIVSTIIPNTAAETATTASHTANAAAATSNGILLDSPSATTLPSSTSPSSPSSTSSSSSSNNKLTPTILDFARVVILFIFQEESLGTAVNAQARLQDALEGVQAGKGGDMGSMSAGNGTGGGAIVVDFVHLTVDLGNGTRFGGAGGAV
ncbi:MAG: hypothetical protein HETSPECPRED_007724 [Heterodermia speciosa]|uniref:EGF-like domain-containing protein n=1 Tax=Heterodermia speciosa TaxID=116794 RepID=A0A8H3G088_9LECA|nr:MAG: hypothetical protein HETSPECPRED_007724 [Heterodermia speciosa]